MEDKILTSDERIMAGLANGAVIVRSDFYVSGMGELFHNNGRSVL